MMALFSGRLYHCKRFQFLLVVSISVFLGVLLFSRHLLFDTSRQSPFNKSSYPFGHPSPSSSGSLSFPKTKPGTYAVAIFLGTEFDAEEDDEDNADHYYVGVRTLVYQMLHAPGTRFTSPISVVILATEAVRESKRQRLRQDGAVVIDIERIEHSVDVDVPTYHQVFDKLRAFDPSVMPFEKVALLDADMVITRPLDLLFEDANSTQFPVNMNSKKPPPAGLPALPDSYAIAATPDIPGRNDSLFPPDVDHEENRDYFNAGVIVSSPSPKLFQFYLALLAQPELFGHWLPEQDLLNFAHDWDGPMPWRQLDLSWHLIRPTDTDFHAGMAILHCKYWEFVSDRCHNTALARRWEMEGFWEGREGRQ